MKFIPKDITESMSMDDFEVRRAIGVGGFSSVYEGKSKSFSEEAVKRKNLCHEDYWEEDGKTERQGWADFDWENDTRESWSSIHYQVLWGF